MRFALWDLPVGLLLCVDFPQPRNDRDLPPPLPSLRPIRWLLVALVLGLALLSMLIPSPAGAADPVPAAALRYRALLIRSGRAELGLAAPTATLAAQVHQESGWDEAARSPVGAQGLAQFMPATATWLSEIRPDLDSGRVPAPYNPAWALRAMAAYDAWLLSRVQGRDGCQRWAAALSSYNGGLGWWRRDRDLAAARGLDPEVWFEGVALVNAGRAVSAWTENRGYPRRILLLHEPRYEAAGFGRGVCP